MRTGAAALLGAGLLAALPPALGFPPYYLFLLSTAFLLAVMASAWNLLAYAGPISFGHAAFFGLGAYGAALASLGGLSPWSAITLGGLAGAVGAAGVGLLSLRLRGAYLALGTLACAEVLRGLALNWSEVTGGGAGLVGLPALPVLPWLPRPLAGLSVLDSVLVGVTFRSHQGHRRAADRRDEAERLLSLVGLAGKAGARAAALSLGELKRLDLAMAPSSRPALLLLDELASGLSPRGREEVLRFYARLRERGTTIVAAEHSFGPLAQVANRMLVLDQGQIVVDGPPSAVPASPALSRRPLPRARAERDGSLLPGGPHHQVGGDHDPGGRAARAPAPATGHASLPGRGRTGGALRPGPDAPRGPAAPADAPRAGPEPPLTAAVGAARR